MRTESYFPIEQYSCHNAKVVHVFEAEVLRECPATKSELRATLNLRWLTPQRLTYPFPRFPWRFSYAGPRSACRRHHGPASENLHTSGLMRCSTQLLHSITSSARPSNEGGTVSPRALAVLRLITSSNLTGCSIGKSAGFSPFKTFCT